jgi:hypothetical protein
LWRDRASDAVVEPSTVVEQGAEGVSMREFLTIVGAVLIGGLVCPLVGGILHDAVSPESVRRRAELAAREEERLEREEQQSREDHDE